MKYGYRKDGNTQTKLIVLPMLMNISKNAKMIGDYDKNKIYLQSDKIVGNVNSCLSFIKYNNYYISNSSLKEDIRKIVYNHKRIIYILSKKIQEKEYNEITYIDKKYIETILLSEDILANVNIKDQSNSIEDYYTIVQTEDGKQKLNINKTRSDDNRRK